MAIGSGIYRGNLPKVNTLLFTVPSGATKCDVRSITAVNRSETTEAKWWLYLVDPSGTAGDDNVLIPGTKQWKVPAGQNIDYDTWKVLLPGATIWGYTDGDVTLHIDGAVRTS